MEYRGDRTGRMALRALRVAAAAAMALLVIAAGRAAGAQTFDEAKAAYCVTALSGGERKPERMGRIYL